MSNERIDEFLSWRGRLDDPRGVPGQGLDDREATWERLMDKIAETPRRRPFFGYRAAVACVLLALIPAMGLFYDRHNRVVAVRPVERQRVVVPGALVHSPETGTGRGLARNTPGGGAPIVDSSREDAGAKEAATARMEQAPQELLGRAIPARVAREPAREGVTREQQAQQQPVQIAGLATPPAVLPAKISDSAIAVSLKPLKNKQLRVVNINELPGGPGPLPAAVTASDAAKRFEFFLAPGQARMALPPPAPAAEASILKIRLSSSN